MVIIDIFLIVLSKLRGLRFLCRPFSLLGFWIGRSIESPKSILLTWLCSILFRLLHISINIQSGEFILLVPSLSAALLFELFKGILMQIWKSHNILVFIWKIVSPRLRIITPFTFWDMRNLDKRNVCLQTYKNNRIR